jgi:hypothetical protein
MDLPAIVVPSDPPPEEIDALRARLSRIAARAAAIEPGRPFLLVTPLGLARRRDLERALHAAGVPPRRLAPVLFPAAATALYAREDDDEALHRAVAYERVWAARFPGGTAERWDLDSAEAFAQLLSAKRAVRAAVPSSAFQVSTPLRSWVLRLHAFHAPDADRLDLESRLLAAIAGAGG